MGRSIVVEFIVAEENEARKIAGALLENGDYRYFRCLELDISALVELFFLLKGRPFSENYIQEFSVLFRSQDNKTLVIQMPQSFIRTLVNADRQLSDVAACWREKSGIISNEWHSEYRRRVVANLIELAQYANNRKTRLLLRVNV
jgi:hypothetical protein